MTALTTTTHSQPSISGPPAPLSRRALDRIGWLRNGLVVGRLPDEADRAAIGRRLSEIDQSLSHRNPVEIGRAVTRMFVAMKPPQGSEVDAKTVVATYVAATADLPAWAVLDAIDRAIAGRGLSATFAPTVPELRLSVERLLERHRDERATLVALLEAGPASRPDSGARERIAAGLGDLVASLKASVEATRAAEREKADSHTARTKEFWERRRIARCEAAGIDPNAGITPELAALLARDEPEADESAINAA